MSLMVKTDLNLEEGLSCCQKVKKKITLFDLNRIISFKNILQKPPKTQTEKNLIWKHGTEGSCSSVIFNNNIFNLCTITMCHSGPYSSGVILGSDQGQTVGPWCFELRKNDQHKLKAETKGTAWDTVPLAFAHSLVYPLTHPPGTSHCSGVTLGVHFVGGRYIQRRMKTVPGYFWKYHWMIQNPSSSSNWEDYTKSYQLINIYCTSNR